MGGDGISILFMFHAKIKIPSRKRDIEVECPIFGVFCVIRYMCSLGSSSITKPINQACLHARHVEDSLFIESFVVVKWCAAFVDVYEGSEG